MENQKKEFELRQIAAILFAVLAGSQLLSNLPYVFGLSMGIIATSTLMTILFIAGYAVVAYALFIGRRDKVLVAGFGLLAAAKLFTFLAGFGNGLFYTNSWYDGYQISLFVVLPALIDLLGYLAACFVAVALLTEYLSNYKERAVKLWFVPAILIAATFPVAFVVYIFTMMSGWWIGGSVFVGIIPFVGRIITTAAFFFAMSWIVNPDGAPAIFALPGRADNADATQKTVVEDAAYCGLFKHTLLSFLTLGIWPLIWIYRRTGFLNCVEDEPKQTPLYQLLLCMFVPFYMIYWTYVNAKRLEKYAASKGAVCEISTLCLITSLTGTLIPSILMQEKINMCLAVKEVEASSETEEADSTEETATEEVKITFSEKAKVGLVKHTLLYMLTCGIWNFIWIYYATNELNNVPGEEYRKPVTKLLLCMFVPFYMVYWYYVSAQRIDKLAQLKGVKSELSTWTLILSIFMPIIPAILMQEKVNKLVELDK